MVVHIPVLNFSTTNRGASNLSTNVSDGDTLVPQDSFGLSRTGHTVVAVCLGLILELGFLNLLVLLIFAKFRSLWTPTNPILLNISVSDILVCVFGTPFSFAASIQVAKTNLQLAQRREQHILIMVLSMVSCYLLCWMPYGVMALVATFGRSGLVTPVASVVPTVLAKSSTVINPVIYVLFNNQMFRGLCEEGSPSLCTASTPSREENTPPGHLSHTPPWPQNSTRSALHIH